jgi:hypothetical protein
MQSGLLQKNKTKEVRLICQIKTELDPKDMDRKTDMGKEKVRVRELVRELVKGQRLEGRKE